MQEYIKYFTGLKRNYGVCKTTEGFVDAETGKKRYPHEWSSIPVSRTRLSRSSYLVKNLLVYNHVLMKVKLDLVQLM